MNSERVEMDWSAIRLNFNLSIPNLLDSVKRSFSKGSFHYVQPTAI